MGNKPKATLRGKKGGTVFSEWGLGKLHRDVDEIWVMGSVSMREMKRWEYFEICRILPEDEKNNLKMFKCLSRGLAARGLIFYPLREVKTGPLCLPKDIRGNQSSYTETGSKISVCNPTRYTYCGRHCTGTHAECFPLICHKIRTTGEGGSWIAGGEGGGGRGMEVCRRT